MLNIGPHISLRLELLQLLKEHNIKCCQLFAGSPHSYSFSLFSNEKIRSYIKENEITVLIHAPYTISLAWKFKDYFEYINSPQGKRLVADLRNGEYLGATAVVIHAGKCAPRNGKNMGNDKGKISRKRALKRMARYMLWTIKEAREMYNVKNCYLVLENSVGAGSEVGHTLKEMEIWWNYVKSIDSTQLGFCIDTCHLFSAGEYNISKPSEVKRFFRDWEEKIKINAIKCGHFNGSKREFGCNVDRHDSLISLIDGNTQLKEKGLIEWINQWNKYNQNKPLITELPSDLELTIKQIKIVKQKWVKPLSLRVYTDGCYLFEKNKAGWAYVITKIKNGKEIIINKKNGTLQDFHSKDKKETNNRAELIAIKKAIQDVICDNLTIFSDSMYSIQAVTTWYKKWKNNGWKTESKTNVKNQDLIKSIIKLKKGKAIEFKHIKAHNKNEFNELADSLAKKAAIDLKEDRFKKEVGIIRVGKRIYREGKYTDPFMKGFTPIITLTKSTPYGHLGPYVLRTKNKEKNEDNISNNGVILENYYQFSKIYEEVPYVKETYSRYNSQVIWEYPTEKHINNTLPKPNPIITINKKYINKKYWKWRQKGFECQYPVRYPVGRSKEQRAKCIGSIVKKGDKLKLLNYVEARKRIYLPIYKKSVKKETSFKNLVNRVQRGENLLIIEVDGPHQESLRYYRKKYGVSKNFIEKDTMIATFENIDIMLNDTLHPFGHGYCLALCILEELNKNI